MIRKLRLFLVLLALVGLIAPDHFSIAQSKGKGQDHKEQEAPKGSKAKKHEHLSGKDLVGSKIKQNGKHKIHEHGKFAASVDVTNGKIAGVSVKHADKGDVPVTKYKSKKQMARGPSSGIQLASLALAQDEYLGTVWIGYAYIDDYGEEIIYWFPYDMILDGDTGAVWYYPTDY